MRNTIFGSVLGQSGGGDECPVGEVPYSGGMCGPPTCRVGQKLDADGNCVPLQDADHYGCLRFSGLFDLIDPATGDVLETGVLETDLPPNTARLYDTGNQCYQCPPSLEPHESGYGCCEPAEYVQNENGECVRTRVCHHPGPSYDYAEAVPDEFLGVPWAEIHGPDYMPPPPEVVEDMVGAEACGIPGSGSGGAGGAGDTEGKGPSTALVAGAAVLVAVGVAIWG